jgi:hypothetical protein
LAQVDRPDRVEPVTSVLRSLGDAQLVEQTLPLASTFGVKLIACVAVAALLAGFALGVRTGAAVLGLGVLIALISQRLRASSDSVRRARAAEQELRRRFGADPLAQRLPEARAELQHDPELELLGLFRGTLLPQGGLHSIRVELRAQPKLIVCASPALAELRRAAASALQMTRRELPLSAAQAERVRTLVRELSENPPAPLASFVQDGFPCEASVLWRTAVGTQELRGSANLAGLPEQLKRHPSVRLIELFLELESEVAASDRLG